MNYYLDIIAEKLDTSLFYEDVSKESHHFQAFMNYFDGNFAIPFNFLKYLKKEIKFGLVLNTSVAILSLILIPALFSTFWNTNACLTVWLSILGLLNWIIIWPKLTILRRIAKITTDEHTSHCVYLMWALLRSKLYNFNNRISKYIFCLYVVGGVMIWFCRSACPTLYWICSGLLMLFVFRIFFSQFQFNETFADYDKVDMLFDYLDGVTSTKHDVLKVFKYSELIQDPKHAELKSCPICYENYSDECLLKVMECSGQHIFHQKCIDCWLMKSEKCPLCNCSAYQQKEGNSK